MLEKHIESCDLNEFTESEMIYEGNSSYIHKAKWKNGIPVVLKFSKNINNSDTRRMFEMVQKHTENILVHKGKMMIADFDHPIFRNSDSIERCVYGSPAFTDPQALNKIVIHVLKGERENPIENMPLEYIKLYKRGWNENSTDRPEVNDILEVLEQCILKKNYEIMIK
ncbi:23957_t:CDS:2 [Gigaspora rosea]|nr:23957_t:CDS:2 [Gigaspora rosea]